MDRRIDGWTMDRRTDRQMDDGEAWIRQAGRVRKSQPVRRTKRQTELSLLIYFENNKQIKKLFSV